MFSQQLYQVVKSSSQINPRINSFNLLMVIFPQGKLKRAANPPLPAPTIEFEQSSLTNFTSTERVRQASKQAKLVAGRKDTKNKRISNRNLWKRHVAEDGGFGFRHFYG